MLWLLAAGGCAEGPKVVTDVDPSAKFPAYRTFAFSGMTDRGREVGPSDMSRLGRRLQDLVDIQLAGKGLRQVGVEDHPDLLVHLFIGVRDRLREGVPPRRIGGYVGTTTYAYHEGAWTKVPAGGGGAADEEHEGALIVDLTEASNNKLVWRAKVTAVLEDSVEKNFDLASKGIAKAFEAYPPAK